MKSLATLLNVSLFTLAAAGTHADLVAVEDFDGGAINLTSSNVTNLDGGGGDAWGVGSINNWFQPSGVPFGLADDSVVSVGGSVFAGDLEGVFGQNADFDNRFFGISDSDEFGTDQTSNWSFNIAGYQSLTLAIDMGGIADGGSFGGYSTQTLSFKYSIDGGPEQTALLIQSTTDIGGFTYRAMDGGSVTPAVGVLEVLGDNAITKLLAEDGSLANNVLVDKTPASGPGAGMMDTFLTSLIGEGDELLLSLNGDFPFEAFAFDNIVIEGSAVPEPSTYALLIGVAIFGLAWLKTGIKRK